MATLAFTRTGAGPPLILLHGLGSSRRAWHPVMSALAERFDVIAVDLPGFGDSEPLAADIEPSPAALAMDVADFLTALGITTPHVAGNSLGGWVALELAHIRPVASLALLSPAGMWPSRTPLYCRVSLRASRWLTRHAAGLISRVVRYRMGRALVLGQTHGRPFRIAPDYARNAVRAMGSCPGFDATYKATLARRYLGGSPIDAPVTVAFGTRDRLLLRRTWRSLGEFPPSAHLAPLPGCGHVPMADDPAAVAALIAASATRDLTSPTHLAQPSG